MCREGTPELESQLTRSQCSPHQTKLGGHTVCMCVDVHVCMDKKAFTLVIQCDLLFSYYQSLKLYQYLTVIHTHMSLHLPVNLLLGFVLPSLYRYSCVRVYECISFQSFNFILIFPLKDQQTLNVYLGFVISYRPPIWYTLHFHKTRSFLSQKISQSIFDEKTYTQTFLFLKNKNWDVLINL